jgi:hypothetical protein
MGDSIIDFLVFGLVVYKLGEMVYSFFFYNLGSTYGN